MAHGSKYERLKDQAVIAVLTCANRKTAAAELGISPRTLDRWCEREDFQAALTERAAQIGEKAASTLDALVDDIEAAGGEALKTLITAAREATKVNQWGEVPDWPARVAAANSIMRSVTEIAKLRELQRNHREVMDELARADADGEAGAA